MRTRRKTEAGERARTAAARAPAATAPREVQTRLRLYVAGMTPRSARALANIKAICEELLKGRYVLEVIDIYQQPTLAAGDQIVAVPTLLKRLPPPLRRLIGDLSDRHRVLVGLDLVPREWSKGPEHGVGAHET